ncbi:uncharacterized protein LOC144107961 [Amblyomma americanum]
MAPKDSALYQHAAYLRDLSPRVFSSADMAYARLQELEEILWSRGANLKARCVPGHPLGCELQNQLEQWNPILGQIHAQLGIRDCSGELFVAVVPSGEGGAFGPNCGEERAIILFHWLLVNHSCVTAIRVEEWGCLFFRLSEGLLVDGVAKCTRLRSLELCAERFPGQYEQLLNAVLLVPDLEEIICPAIHVVRDGRNINLLAKLIAKNAKLHRFVVERFIPRGWDPPGMSCISEALKTNAAISDLCLDVTVLKEEEYHPFCEGLKELRSLKSLHLVATRETSTLNLAAIAEVVEASKTLTALQLTDFYIETSDVWALTRSLSIAGTVEELAIVSCSGWSANETGVILTEPGYEDEYPGFCIPYHLCFHMVRTLTSLRKLRLPFPFFLKYKGRLFEALNTNRSIEEVRFDVGRQPFRVVRDTGNGWIIEIVGVCHPLYERVSEGARVRSFDMPAGETAVGAETLLHFTQICTLNELTTLSVGDICMSPTIQAEHAEVLAQFLRETKTLNEVEMNFYARRAQSHVLLDALRHNTSITVLVVECWCLCERTTGLLVDIVCSSKKIRAFTYNWASGEGPQKFFFMLAKAIQTNCTILSVKPCRSHAAARHLDRIEEVLARNKALPFRAAWFVTGRTVDKRGAEALELLGPDPVVVSKVREMLSMGEIEAEEATRRKLSDLDDMNAFMRAAGVVRESVVCDGRPSLDALPFFCWLHLRRYLRVADIVDQPGMR